MIIIELFNETTTIQCRTQEEADAVLAKYQGAEDPHYQGLAMREIEVEIEEEEPLE